MTNSIRGLFLLVLMTISAVINAQTTKPPAKQAIKDTFAFNILTTIDKVLRFVEDPNKHAMALAGELLSTENNGVGIYRSIIQIPTLGEATLKAERTNRTQGYSNWEWQGMVYRFPKGQKTAMLQATAAKLDTLIKSFDTRKKPAGFGYSISVRAWFDKSWLEQDELSVIISFSKKLYNTEQRAIDSIVQLYRPLLTDPGTAGKCTPKFTGALEAEGIAEAKIKEVFIGEMKEIANKNIRASYDMLIAGPYYVDVKEASAKLSAYQQEEFKKMASKAVEEFYDAQNRTQTKDIVVEKKKELEKVNPPADPCEREMWETGVKTGKYLNVNGKTCCVTNYSCTLHTYTIAWVENGKLQFMRGIKRDDIKNYSPSYSYTFLVCSHCNGAGHSMENDWYQMGVGSNFYARSDKQTKYTCGVCHGAGFMKIR